MTGYVHVPDEAQEYFFEEGCFILELWNDPADRAASVARARVPPGITTRWHRLRDTTERYLILAGSGEVSVGDQSPAPVRAGDLVHIPPMTRQRIRNTGTEDLVFAAICTPRFEHANYVLEPYPDDDSTDP